MAEQVIVVVTEQVAQSVSNALNRAYVAHPEGGTVGFTLDRQVAIDLMGALALATGAVNNNPPAILE